MAISNDVDKILYKLGYYNDDPNKKQEIQGYIDEAVEFMKDSGVNGELLKTQRAFAIKSIWADCRDKGDDNDIIRREGMIVSLISQLKRSSNGSNTTNT